MIGQLLQANFKLIKEVWDPHSLILVRVPIFNSHINNYKIKILTKTILLHQASLW